MLGHRHKNCPKYWCHVCYHNAPGHLSIHCKDLKAKVERQQIRTPPPDDLKAWEKDIDADELEAWRKEHGDEIEEFEEQHGHEYSDDPIYYDRNDD